jgi:hypothetical protein
MMQWIFLMMTAQFFVLLGLIAVLVDIKRTLRDIDQHLWLLYQGIGTHLAHLTGSATGTGGRSS